MGRCHVAAIWTVLAHRCEGCIFADGVSVSRRSRCSGKAVASPRLTTLGVTMQLSAVLLRWYRSFNVRTLSALDDVPSERWNNFGGQIFPFIAVPLDSRITSIVGA